MRANITDSQYSTLIGVIARVPIEQARRLVLEKIEASLPKTGKITDAQLLAAINEALASIKPGAFRGDAQGAYPSDTSTMTLREAEDLYFGFVTLSKNRLFSSLAQGG